MSSLSGRPMANINKERAFLHSCLRDSNVKIDGLVYQDGVFVPLDCGGKFRSLHIEFESGRVEVCYEPNFIRANPYKYSKENFSFNKIKDLVEHYDQKEKIENIAIIIEERIGIEKKNILYILDK